MYFAGILEEERKENKQQADESAKQIKLLQGIFLPCLQPSPRWFGEQGGWILLLSLSKWMSTQIIWIPTLTWTGQLRQLQDEMVILREQIDVSSGSRDELQSARDEVKSLKRALESAAAERDRDVAAIQTNLATVSKDLDKWRQTASKYEHEIDNLQRDLQQQSKQWQKTAEIQGTTTWCTSTYLFCKVSYLNCRVNIMTVWPTQKPHCFLMQLLGMKGMFLSFLSISLYLQMT